MRALPSNSLTLVGLFAVGCVSVLGYSCSTHVQSLPDAPRAALPAAAVQARGEEGLPARPSEARVEQASPPVDTANLVPGWIAAATGEDAQARASAIAALAAAPKSQAMPVLQRVLVSGDNADREIALRTLRILAQKQGDADGGIRNVLREAIYHGDDEAVTIVAQSTLSEVEQDLSRRAQSANP